MAKSIRDLESLLQDGEAKGAPQGFRAQTVNGTSHAMSLGWNQQPPVKKNPTARAGGAWQTPRSNRTGE